MTTKLILSTFVLLFAVQFSFAQSVSNKNIHQVLSVAKDVPSRIILKLRTPNYEIVRTGSNEIFVKGSASLDVPYKNFLNKLVEDGRYDLAVIPNELRNMELEEKFRAPISISKKDCIEEVKYTIYVPAKVEVVEVENLITGNTETIVLNPTYQKPQITVALK